MRATNWSAATVAEHAYCRADGRQRYNCERQLNAELRQMRVLVVLEREGWTGREWGIRATIARELGVSRATTARDFQHLERSLVDGDYAKDWLHFYRWWR